MLRRLLSIMLAQLLLVSVCAGGLGSERQKSDSEVKGLKGQPQKVTYEWATLTKTGEAVTEAERKISSIETYDPQGNLTQVESYFQGSIHSRTHYFNLDGARASKFEILSQINGGGGIGVGGEQGKADPRFNTKYKYKYDKQGNRVEMTEINNYGRKTGVTTYKYDAQGNLLESDETLYMYRVSPPEFKKKSVYQLNEKGETIHLTQPTYTVDYSDYKYDEKGNWISRKMSSVATYYNKKYPHSQMEYRTIIYYTAPAK